MMTRRDFGQGALGSLLAPPFVRAPGSVPRRPNVLLVLADEWRSQSTGYAGDPNVRTPALDRFAAESMSFENAISGCSVCCPARASLITGQYPLTHGVYINDVPLRPRHVTLGEAFAKGGYRTGYIGKWHLHGSPDGHYGRREAPIPRASRFGFQYWKAAECTHDYNRSLYYADDDPVRKYWNGYDAIAQTDDACRYIRECSQTGVPYFLVLSWGPPHSPFHSAPGKYRDMCRDMDIAPRPNVPDECKAEAIDDLRGYSAHMAALDDCFAALLGTIAATGSTDDTIVVFTSDHGNMMGSQGLEYKLCPWEESIRIPLLVRYPRKWGSSGRRSAAPINSPDVMPTLLGLCGMGVPAGVQGIDFSSCRTRDVPQSAFIALPVPITSACMYGIAEYRGVRTSTHTYVRSITGPWLLYDNANDPYQKANLCNRREAASIQKEMEGELQRWLKELNDDFRPAGEYLARDRLTHYVETQTPVGQVRSPWGDWESTLRRSAA
jgi:arylsulfatase A-like enzyme